MDAKWKNMEKENDLQSEKELLSEEELHEVAAARYIFIPCSGCESIKNPAKKKDCLARC